MKNIYLNEAMVEIGTKNDTIGIIEYLIINDISEFTKYCEENNIVNTGVNEVGLYKWDWLKDIWRTGILNDEEISQLINIKEQMQSIINNEYGDRKTWKLIVLFANNETFHLSLQQANLNDVFEKIKYIQKLISHTSEQIKSITIE